MPLVGANWVQPTDSDYTLRFLLRLFFNFGLYVAEMVANALIDKFTSTHMMDMHGDSSLTTQEVWHIHCRHGDKDFSKFEFFKHHYDTTDLSTLNIGIVKDYATFLAARTWRAIGGGRKAEQNQNKRGTRDEL